MSDKEFTLRDAYVMPVDEKRLLPGVSPQTVMAVSISNIRDVLAHTEIIETNQGDLIASPDQVWLVPNAGQKEISWEVELSEEQFWLIVGAVYGAQVVAEMKQELDDLLRWEGEGGSCLS